VQKKRANKRIVAGAVILTLVLAMLFFGPQLTGFSIAEDVAELEAELDMLSELDALAQDAQELDAVSQEIEIRLANVREVIEQGDVKDADIILLKNSLGEEQSSRTRILMQEMIRLFVSSLMLS